MTGKRQYEDSCGMAEGVNFVGDCRALPIVRALLGPKRFVSLRSAINGVSQGDYQSWVRLV